MQHQGEVAGGSPLLWLLAGATSLGNGHRGPKSYLSIDSQALNPGLTGPSLLFFVGIVEPDTGSFRVVATKDSY